MKRRWTLAGALALVCAGVAGAEARAALLTIDEAVALSQQTGRPIFAVAGSKTCAPCQALIERLNTDLTIRPLAVQFVPLKVDTDGGEAWQKWASQYKHEGNGIPIIFIIRADGKMLYGKSGGMGSDALRQFMAQHLAQAGRVFNEEEARLLAEALEKAKKAVEEEKTAEALKAVFAMKKLGPPGNLGSFAKAALEADELVKKLLEGAKAKIGEAQQQVTGGNASFDAVLALVETKRLFGTFPELRTELAAATKDLNKDETARELVKQAEALDKALALRDLPGGDAKAASALKRVLESYADGPAAEAAKKHLEDLGVTDTAVAVRPEKPGAGAGSEPGGDSSSGAVSGATARRKASASLRMAKVFAETRPDKARQYAEEVIKLMPDSAEAREAKEILEQLR